MPDSEPMDQQSDAARAAEIVARMKDQRIRFFYLKLGEALVEGDAKAFALLLTEQPAPPQQSTG